MDLNLIALHEMQAIEDANFVKELNWAIIWWTIDEVHAIRSAKDLKILGQKAKDRIIREVMNS
jgi:hypothetical protein